MENIKPVSYRDVQITGGFWKKWQDAAAEATIPAIYEQFSLTGRFDALAHKWREGEPDKPHIFYDSDAAKWIEGAAYSLFFRPDPETEKRIDAIVDMIEEGMSPEGYFNSYYQTIEPHARWTRRENHELYCAGHLIEAAVAYYEAIGKRRFLDLMIRYSEYIYKIFVEEKSAAFVTPGHEEIELALVRLWQCTGEKKWLDLAGHFINLRGADPAELCFNNWFSPKYAQDQAPVADQETAEGHVVRFGYLFCAAADLARETCDEKLLEACRRVWRDVVTRKMYVTGGVGNMKHGEAFGPAYMLPNFEAYTETCASIALAFFGHRLSQIDPLGEYADICELQLYNGALAGISLDGRSFFYENPLSFRPSDQHFLNANKASGRPAQRVEVFSCSCCPPNILRMITSVGDWMYGVGALAPRGGGEENGAGAITAGGAGEGAQNNPAAPVIYVHQFAESAAKIKLPLTNGDIPVTLTQKTNYPWEGKVVIKINAQAPFEAAFAIRSPGWCSGAKLNFASEAAGGYMFIRREWADGDVIELDLPMEITELESNPFVQQDAGRAALMRGPLVYCVEGEDNGDRLDDLLIPADACYEAVWDESLYGGVCTLRFGAFRRKQFGELYRRWSPEYEETAVIAVPYYAWGNRGEGEMCVWLRKNSKL